MLTDQLQDDFIIEESDFKMAFDGRCGFDLYFKNSKNNWVLQGYNVTFGRCIKLIIYYRINNNSSIIDLKTFLKLYIKEKEDLLKTIKQFMNV